MSVWETMPTIAALLLATVAAVMSGNPAMPQEVTSFVVAAMAPTAADLGEFADPPSQRLIPPPL